MFQADSYNLRYAAQRCSSGAVEMRGQARRYSDSAQNLLHYWKGDAAQIFCHAHEQLAADLQRLADAFERTAGELQSLASRNDHIQELKRQAQQVEWQLQSLDESDPHDRSEARYLRQRLHDLSYAAEMEARAADERAKAAFQEIGVVTTTLFVSAVQVHASTSLPSKEQHWWEKALDFLSGVVYSMGDSSSFGLLGLALDDEADLRSEEYLRGKIFGDYLSTGIGVVTAVEGLLLAAEGAVGGALFAWTGVGLAVGAGVSVVGVAEAAYGTGVAVKGYANLQKDKVILEARKTQSESTAKGTGESTKVNYGDHFTKVDGRNGLKPDVEYTTNEGYHYKTDSNGRISSAEANLQLGKADRNQYAQRKVGGDDRLPSDDGGHLIASIFKGSGEIDNLVPMNATLNRSEYKALENIWKKALEEGKAVQVKIFPIYKNGSTRPSKFEVEYIIDGKKYEVQLTNYEGGHPIGNR